MCLSMLWVSLLYEGLEQNNTNLTCLTYHPMETGQTHSKGPLHVVKGGSKLSFFSDLYKGFSDLNSVQNIFTASFTF